MPQTRSFTVPGGGEEGSVGSVIGPIIARARDRSGLRLQVHAAPRTLSRSAQRDAGGFLHYRGPRHPPHPRPPPFLPAKIKLPILWSRLDLMVRSRDEILAALRPRPRDAIRPEALLVSAFGQAPPRRQAEGEAR